VTNKLVIAAAGSGKTSYLIRRALDSPSKRTLLTTYTENNEAEIRSRFVQLNGCVPANVRIQTWFSFLIEHGARPYQGYVYDSDIRGMQLVSKRSGVRFRTKEGQPRYWGEDDLENFYFDQKGKIYSDKLAKFALRCQKESKGAVGSRIEKIFDEIMIDEVQDLAGFDLDIILLFLKLNCKLLMVGDPRQVTYLTAHVPRLKKYADGKIAEFLREKAPKRTPCEIDEQTLNVSHRNNAEICAFSSLLYPSFEPSRPCDCAECQAEAGTHRGIFLVRAGDVPEYLRTYRPTQLKWDNRVSVDCEFEHLTFGRSKGRSFDHVLIYPTKRMIEWLRDQNNDLAQGTRAKLYVAITRARHSAAFVIDELMEKPAPGAEWWDSVKSHRV